MKQSEEERCAEARRFELIDKAFRQGDLDALLAAVEDPDSVPNGPMPLSIGPCLEYAIYWSPLRFIRTLLELGADPVPANHAGFPPLVAALSCTRARDGAKGRNDVAEILQLLLDFGADPGQRGHNDWTALHMAVAERNGEAVRILLERGADPNLRTRIDDLDTPREMAEALGLDEIVRILETAEKTAENRR